MLLYTSWNTVLHLCRCVKKLSMAWISSKV